MSDVVHASAGLPLFAYGTLRDPHYQTELFDRTYPMRPARVTGFVVRSTSGGYLAATACPDGTVDGALIDLDAHGYAIADGWEDLTVYERIEVEAQLEDGRTLRAFMYVRPNVDGAPVTDARLADRPPADVIADIRRFRAATTVADRL